MSCMMLNDDFLATLADGLETVLNTSYNFKGFDAPESLHEAFNECRNNRYYEYNAHKIFATLYNLNMRAYCGRYKGEFPTEAPEMPKNYKRLKLRVDWVGGRYAFPDDLYQLAKMLDCYWYQVSEDATDKDPVTLAIVDLRNTIALAIMANSEQYKKFNWGEV